MASEHAQLKRRGLLCLCVAGMSAVALALLLLCCAASVQAAESSGDDLDTQDDESPSPLIPYHLSHGAFYTETHARGDLPQLAFDRSPGSKSWNNSVAVCAVSTHDNTRDVREWVQFQRWLGVQHVFLADNGERKNGALRSQLRDFVKEGFVTLRSDALGKSRISVYWDCMVQHRHKYNWLAFIDTDEYMVVRKQNTTLTNLLDNFKFQPGLAVHMIDVGPSGRMERAPRGGVLRLYRQCSPRPSNLIRTIANTYFLANIAPHPYTMEFRGDTRAVNERMAAVPWQNITDLPQFCESYVAPSSLRMQCRPVPGDSIPYTSVEHITIFHYITQSKQDWPNKVHHFAADGETEEDSWLFFDNFPKHAALS